MAKKAKKKTAKETKQECASWKALVETLQQRAGDQGAERVRHAEEVAAAKHGRAVAEWRLDRALQQRDAAVARLGAVEYALVLMTHELRLLQIKEREHRRAKGDKPPTAGLEAHPLPMAFAIKNDEWQKVPDSEFALAE